MASLMRPFDAESDLKSFAALHGRSSSDEPRELFRRSLCFIRRMSIFTQRACYIEL